MGLRVIEKVGSIWGCFSSSGLWTFLSWFSLPCLFFLNSHFNHLKPYNSMAVSTFTMLCNHHHYLISEHFRYPRKETLYPLKSHFLLSLPLSPWQLESVFCVYEFCLFWILNINKITYKMWSFVSDTQMFISSLLMIGNKWKQPNVH